MRVPDHERGAALLAVLLLVAVMGAIAAAAFDKLRLSTALAVNGAALDQARAYAVGLEHLLAVRVDDLAGADPDVTPLADDWNGVRRPIPLPGGGRAEAALRDGGNCFNLNSLVDGNVNEGYRPRAAAAYQFVGLMRTLGVADDAARRIADSATDWIDSDGDASAQGAEDAAYAGGGRPYRPGNTLFAERSELRAVAGVSGEVYERLRPFLCALPATDLSPVNPNTLAPEQAPVLAMLAPGMVAPEQARRLIAARPPGGWRSLEEFWTGAAQAGLSPSGDALGQVSLATRWFAVELAVEHGGAEVIETALIDARLSPARIVARRWGTED